MPRHTITGDDFQLGKRSWVNMIMIIMMILVDPHVIANLRIVLAAIWRLRGNAGKATVLSTRESLVPTRALVTLALESSSAIRSSFFALFQKFQFRGFVFHKRQVVFARGPSLSRERGRSESRYRVGNSRFISPGHYSHLSGYGFLTYSRVSQRFLPLPFVHHV
ncbi:hypothetical protein F5887DRAFT_341587 [Amanita rubescens]|nr:hypothetical protein F5887DRAFT_341587 [Amanita rubescens]